MVALPGGGWLRGWGGLFVACCGGSRGNRWAAVFGRIAGYSFVVAVVTGVLLLPLFRPSMAAVVYHGSYRVLDGVPVSRAYRSVLAISFGVRGGLLIRQVHHWSAEVFVGGYSEITEPERPVREEGPESALPRAGDMAARSQH